MGMNNSHTLQLLYVALVMVLVISCNREESVNVPEPAGAPIEVSGSGLIAEGSQPGNLVIKPENSDETYCLTGNDKTRFAPGDRVRFKGKRFTALMLKGETCLRLDATLIEKL